MRLKLRVQVGPDHPDASESEAVLKPARQLPALLGTDGKDARNFILDPPRDHKSAVLVVLGLAVWA